MSEVVSAVVGFVLVLFFINAGIRAVFIMLRGISVFGAVAGAGLVVAGLVTGKYALCVVGALFFAGFNAIFSWLGPQKKS